MKTEMKVLLYLKRNEQNEDGLCPLMGKITLRGKQNSSAQFGCKIKVNPGIWNSTSQRCTGKSRIAIKTNKEIESLLLLLRQRFNELYDMGESFSALDVKNAFQGIASAQATILKIFEEHNDEFALRVGVNRSESSHYHYWNTCRKLSEFIRFKYKVSDIPVKSLDFMFIESFDSYLRVERKYKPVTILGHIKLLKSIIRIAIYRDILSTDPFAGFTPQIPEKKQLYLTEEELSKLMNTTFDTPNRNFTRDMFLFSVFTGICYCDMRNLTESNLVKDNEGRLWIEARRKKTGTPENVLLLDIPIKLIEKYKGMAPDGKLFPMLTKESLNRHLKKIAVQCGMTRNLSFHAARHTFGSQICLSQGVPIETVSKAMGHKNISTTQRYAKVTHEKIDRDVTVLHANISNKYSLQGIDTPPSTILKDMSRRKTRPSRKLQPREEL
jgi:integrase